MPWRVEGTAEAGVGWGMPGAAVLARAGMCPPAEGAGGWRVGRAKSPIAWGRCGSCFTCGSRVAAIPPRAAMRSLASVPRTRVVTKERKGEATQRRNKSACTHTNAMQPASHRGSHTRPDSAQTRHTTSIATL